jgi:predicted anti-sigma-YlaC factor YlaD
MMKVVGKEQAGAVAIEMRASAEQAKQAARRRKRLQYKITCWSITTVATLYLIWIVWAIVQIRIDVYPELGTCLIPKGQWPYEHYNNLKWVDCDK